MSARQNWVTADLDGLARLVEDRSRAFIIFELLSNALDENTREVEITLEKHPRKPLARLVVADDNPEGFRDISHAWRMFAESGKKDQAEKRGRFNIGEKLALSMCQNASIATTTGTVFFDDEGRRFDPSQKTATGSRFDALVKMNPQQFQQVLKETHWALIPTGVTVTFNGEIIESRIPINTFEATLPTVIGDSQGALRRSRRKGKIEIYEPRPGEKAMIYELGIPVVETGDRFHVNVLQKIVLNSDRDNVSAAFLREVRSAVLDNTFSILDVSTVASDWVNDALCHKDVSTDAVNSVIAKRFGEKAASYDPSDREANNRAASLGYNIVPGGTFSGDQWNNIKRAKALTPAGQHFPTPRPLFGGLDPSKDTEVPRKEWTEGMHQVVALTHRLAERVMGIKISVRILRSSEGFSACYGSRQLSYNLTRLGRSFFEKWRENLEQVLDVMLDEFGHEQAANHLSEEYYRALRTYGAKMVMAALEDPTLFEPVASSDIVAA